MTTAWTRREGETHGVAFVPMHWSADTAADFGIRPQESINQQLVDRADVVIALFSTRLGTPTGEAESGTVEELTRAAEAGKYVAVLRCRRPVDPSSIDTEQQCWHTGQIRGPDPREPWREFEEGVEGIERPTPRRDAGP